MELFEFNNIIQIVNRFKAVLKQKKVTQIDFAKDKLKISAGLFYNVLTNKMFKWTKKNVESNLMNQLHLIIRVIQMS